MYRKAVEQRFNSSHITLSLEYEHIVALKHIKHIGWKQFFDILGKQNNVSDSNIRNKRSKEQKICQ